MIYGKLEFLAPGLMLHKQFRAPAGICSRGIFLTSTNPYSLEHELYNIQIWMTLIQNTGRGWTKSEKIMTGVELRSLIHIIETNQAAPKALAMAWNIWPRNRDRGV